MAVDLTYNTTGFFTSFYPETKEGEKAYNHIIEVCGSPKILTRDLKITLHQLKKAGYIVKKAKKVSKKEADKIMNDILNDPMFDNI